MVSFLDVCRFTPTLGGTTDWVYSSAVTGYQSPASAGAANATVYRYRAESADLSQWEVGTGTYTSGTTTLTRTTVLFNSSGTGTATGQSGAGTKINFSTVPQVAVVALAEDVNGINGKASAGGAPFTPSGTSSATLVMMGLGLSITIAPAFDTRAFLSFNGHAFNNTAGKSTRVQAYFGTGAAPANGAAVTGTAVGGLLAATSSTANQALPFNVGGLMTGLTIGTTYWVDIAVDVDGGTGTIQAVGGFVFEI